MKEKVTLNMKEQKKADCGILETTPELTTGVIDTSEYAKLKYVHII